MSKVKKKLRYIALLICYVVLLFVFESLVSSISPLLQYTIGFDDPVGMRYEGALNGFLSLAFGLFVVKVIFWSVVYLLIYHWLVSLGEFGRASGLVNLIVFLLAFLLSLLVAPSIIGEFFTQSVPLVAHPALWAILGAVLGPYCIRLVWPSLIQNLQHWDKIKETAK